MNLLIFADRSLFASGLFALKGDLEFERIFRESDPDQRRGKHLDLDRLRTVSAAGRRRGHDRCDRRVSDHASAALVEKYDRIGI